MPTSGGKTKRIGSVSAGSRRRRGSRKRRSSRRTRRH